jgi:GGDEF domain-containing protein
MPIFELAIWSAAAGAIALVVALGLADFALSRRIAALHGVIYNLCALFFVLVMSGIAGSLLSPEWKPELRTAKVLAGPVCAFTGDLLVRAWFGARHRDRLMDLSLLVAGIVIPVLGASTLFALPRAQQLPAAAALVVLNTALVTWMSVRAWLLGDALALGVAFGSLLMVAAVGGLYAIALGVPLGTGAHALIALGAVLCIAVNGIMLWQRNEQASRVRSSEEPQSQYDPVTKLPGGLPVVQHLIRAQKRRRMTRREGAIIAVLVFEPERVRTMAGAAGLNEAYVQIAHRLQHQVGVMNPAGRYWDRCFVVIVESIRTTASLRTMGLRVAAALRRPMHVTAADGSRMQVRLDIGVGVVRLERESAEVEDLLHEAQALAEAARHFASRAATRDPETGDVVPVEHAQLGPRRGRPAPPSTVPRRTTLRRV